MTRVLLIVLMINSVLGGFMAAFGNAAAQMQQQGLKPVPPLLVVIVALPVMAVFVSAYVASIWYLSRPKIKAHFR